MGAVHWKHPSVVLGSKAGELVATTVSTAVGAFPGHFLEGVVGGPHRPPLVHSSGRALPALPLFHSLLLSSTQFSILTARPVGNPCTLDWSPTHRHTCFRCFTLPVLILARKEPDPESKPISTSRALTLMVGGKE